MTLTGEKDKENLWRAFVETTRRHPDRDAFRQGDERTTFAQVGRRAEDYRASLSRFEINTDDRILIWMDASAEAACALAAVWGVGAIPVLMDFAERGPSIQHVFETTGPSLGIRPGGPPLPELGFDLEILDGSEVTTGSPYTQQEPEPVIDGNAPASVLFTSGSTGMPKGVTQSHGSLVRGTRTVAGYLGLNDLDSIACGIPWTFDYGYGQLLMTLLNGTTQVLPTAPGPAQLCDAITLHRPTVLPVIPSLLTYLVRGLTEFPKIDRSSLRILTNTGGTIPEPILLEALELLSGCEFFLNYGLTESYRTSFLDPRCVRERSTSIGRAIPGVDIAILREGGELAKPNEVGEIVHRGDYLFLRYWNDPEATARALRTDPLTQSSDAPPALFTGDLGRFDEAGFLYFEGRRDRQIKSMGVRVNPSAVEAQLHASGLIREAAVFSRPNDLIGQEVWAAVVPGSDDPKLVQRLGAHAHKNLSKYVKPRHYIVMERLPVTATGKTDYLELERLADESKTASLIR
jgi:long-chain acyl-CoA synthetase